MFPNYTGSSNSETEKGKKSPETKKLEKEMTQLETAVSENIKSFQSYNQVRKINSLNDLKKCIDNFGISNFWTVHDNCNKVSLFHVELDP